MCNSLWWQFAADGFLMLCCQRASYVRVVYGTAKAGGKNAINTFRGKLFYVLLQLVLRVTSAVDYFSCLLIVRKLPKRYLLLQRRIRLLPEHVKHQFIDYPWYQVIQ